MFVEASPCRKVGDGRLPLPPVWFRPLPPLTRPARRAAPVSYFGVTGKTTPLRRGGGTRPIAARRSPVQARRQEQSRVPSDAADRPRAADLRCCLSCSATSRPATVRQQLVPRIAASRLVDRRHESSRDRIRTGMDRRAEARLENPKQRSGSSGRVPSFWRALFPRLAARHRLRVRRSRVRPAKLHSCRYRRRPQAQKPAQHRLKRRTRQAEALVPLCPKAVVPKHSSHSMMGAASQYEFSSDLRWR